MKEENVMQDYLSFFTTYVSEFIKNADDEKVKNYSIKKDHSYRVAENCEKIARSLELTADEIELAFLTGLYHDIGRFPQLEKYNTFNDATSVDHADLSFEVINKNGVFDNLEPDIKKAIETAILYHNKLALPKGLTEKELLLGKILRDADKLDILQVLSAYYSNKNSVPNHTLTWELPITGVINKKIVNAVINRQTVLKEWVESQSDIKVFQLSWVFDINFKYTFKVLADNRYIQKIYESLPKNDEVYDIYRVVKIFMDNKLM